jgi:capsular exopolysaccharide synthesis family protein
MADPGASGAPLGFQPMGFRDYLAVLNRRRGVIVLVTLIVFGIGLYFSLNQTSVYKASGEVLLRVEGAEAGTVPTEARILESPAVHELALEKDPNAGEVSATDDPSVNVITVTAEDDDADQAAATVNAHMNAYVEYSRQAELDRYLTALKVIQPTIDDLQKQIDALGPAGLLTQENADRRSSLLNQQLNLRAKLQDLQVDATLAGANAIVVADASVPGTPIRPKPVRDALIALGAGLLLAVALAFVVELLDDSIRTSEDFQRTIGTLPVLAMIPPMRMPRHGLVTVVAPRSTPAEAYRAFRTAVQFIVMERGACIEIASARAGEGKSVTMGNLAVALAQAGQQVVVVDADLRAPTMHDLLGVSNDVGLTSVVSGEPLANALQRVPQVPNLSVLTAGPIPANPSEVIASDRFRRIVRDVRKEAAIVLIDTPPILAVTDAMVVGGIVDAVVVIARAGSSTRRQVRHSLQVMRQLGAPVVGAVLNAAPEPRAAYYVRVTRPSRRSRGLWRGGRPVPTEINTGSEPPTSDPPPAKAPGATVSPQSRP